MNDNFISDLTSLQFAAAAAVVNLSVTNELVTNRKYIYIVYIIYKKGTKVKILQALRLLCDFVWV